MIGPVELSPPNPVRALADLQVELDRYKTLVNELRAIATDAEVNAVPNLIIQTIDRTRSTAKEG
jgi:hypothetical protein